ncbi:MAG: hypothetical protein P4M11_14605 [Candidatus Pacebacteria bacterium]|nr:hypothetical protein [Candidatus Paceibacterota bacterium]
MMNEKEELVKEFAGTVAWMTLRFHDPISESAYMERRLVSATRSLYVLFSFLIYISVLSWRTAALIYQNDMLVKNANDSTQIVILSLFWAALFLELLLIFRYKLMRGMLTLVMSSVLTYYISYASFPNPPALSHMYGSSSNAYRGLIYILANLSIVTNYVYSWLMGVLACMLGYGASVYFLIWTAYRLGKFNLA